MLHWKSFIIPDWQWRWDANWLTYMQSEWKMKRKKKKMMELLHVICGKIENDERAMNFNTLTSGIQLTWRHQWHHINVIQWIYLYIFLSFFLCCEILEWLVRITIFFFVFDGNCLVSKYTVCLSIKYWQLKYGIDTRRLHSTQYTRLGRSWYVLAAKHTIKYWNGIGRIKTNF